MSQLKDLTARIIAFRDERDWQQFHNAKDLALSLTLEAAAGVMLDAWRDVEQRVEVAAAQRHRLDPLAVDAPKRVEGNTLFALLTHDMLSRVPRETVAMAGGITAAAQSLAYIVANPLIGRSVQRSGSYTATLVMLGAWLVPGTVAWLTLRRGDPSR